MAENKQSLFRQKNIDTIESPESLNDYLKVTSPGIWLFLLAVALILVGAVIWSIFGTIDTSVKVAVLTQNETTYCIVPYEKTELILASGKVKVGDTEYTFTGSATISDSIQKDTNVDIRLAGEFEVGDIYAVLPVEEFMDSEDIVQGIVTTESLTPITLLLQ